MTNLQDTENFKKVYERKVSELKQIHLDYVFDYQPFVVINGSSLKNISDVQVVVGKQIYQVPSLLHGVDACFQIMKVLNEPFSAVCNHVWQFLESQVYGIPCEGVSALTTLIQQITEISN